MRRLMSLMVLVAMVAVVTLTATSSKAEGMKERVGYTMVIQQMYMDILGREATAEDVQNCELAVKQGNELKKIRNMLILSQECENAIKKTYRDSIGREPSDPEIQKVRKAMAENNGTLVDLKKRLQKQGK